MNAVDITDMTDAELDALLDLRSWEAHRTNEHAMMRRLGTLSSKELTALSDRESHRSPNSAHLASALDRLNDENATKQMEKCGPLTGTRKRHY